MHVKHPKDPAYKSTAAESASAEAALASYGVDEYAERFVTVVEQYRRLSEVWKAQYDRERFSEES